MIKEIKEPNWSERLQLLKTSFITMDVAEIWKTEEAEPSGATIRSKCAKEKSEAERKARKFSELERMQLKSAFDSQQDVADQPGLSVTAKDYKYSLLYGLTHDPSFSTYLQDYFSSKISQPVTYEDLKRELTSWAITKDRLNAHNKPSSSRQEHTIPVIASVTKTRVKCTFCVRRGHQDADCRFKLRQKYQAKSKEVTGTIKARGRI
jgi:hypothetical protein